MIDKHLHFTGSLSPIYVYRKLQDSNQAFLDKYSILSPDGLSDTFVSMFGNNYKLNQQKFNELYSLAQSVTKPKNTNEIYQTYRLATRELALNLVHSGILDYTIIAGPDSSVDNTYVRYLGMIHGFEDIEKLYKGAKGKICITFIRTQSGELKNYSYKLLSDICKLLQQEPFKSRCVGFDISGYEYPDKGLLESNLCVLSEIIEASKTSGLKASVGLHAGEIITGTTQDELYDEYFVNLSKLQLDNIGHGTYLWANDTRQKILKLFSGHTRFDLCPESNVLLTPVKRIDSNRLDVLKKCGVEYTINRDDPLFFNNWRQR